MKQSLPRILFASIIVISTAVHATAEYDWNVDWSKVRPRQDEPGFWDGRLIQPNAVPNVRNRRIVGGWQVEQNYHPYQAGLLLHQGQDVFLCGGVVVGKRHVLTAAHCLERIDQAQVVLGAHYLQVFEDTQQRFMVSRFMFRTHERYNTRLLTYDISLLILPRDIVLNDHVQPITLPRSDLGKMTFEGEYATLTGWGRTSTQTWTVSPCKQISRREIFHDLKFFEQFSKASTTP